MIRKWLLQTSVSYIFGQIATILNRDILLCISLMLTESGVLVFHLVFKAPRRIISLYGKEGPTGHQSPNLSIVGVIFCMLNFST